MSSEPDNNSGRRPPTIELKATEVDADKPAAAPPDAAAAASADEHTEAPDQQASNPQASTEETFGRPADERSGILLKSSAVGGFIGAIATGAIVAGLWFAGFGSNREVAPASTSAAQPGSAAPPSANDADILARLDKIERTIQAPRPEPALGNRMAAAEAEAKSLADTLAALNRRVDDIAATSQSAAKQANAAAAAADSAKSADQTNVQHGDIDALANRIAALESAVKSLSEDVAHRASGINDQAARLAVAAQALRAAVERGVPYEAELKAVQALGADQNATAPLEPFAATGVPTAAALARELATLTPALERATATASGATSFLGRLEANAQQLVRVTPVDAPPGNDPAAVMTRIKIDTAHRDIAAALNEVAALPDSAKSLTSDWVSNAEARNAAIAASRQIAADALAAFSKPAAQ
jgi:hypothetical protein